MSGRRLPPNHPATRTPLPKAAAKDADAADGGSPEEARGFLSCSFWHAAQAFRSFLVQVPLPLALTCTVNDSGSAVQEDVTENGCTSQSDDPASDGTPSSTHCPGVKPEEQHEEDEDEDEDEKGEGGDERASSGPSHAP
jgi:hypothetical protein